MCRPIRTLFRLPAVLAAATVPTLIALAQQPNAVDRTTSDIVAAVEQRHGGPPGALAAGHKGDKCGLWLAFEIDRHQNEFTPAQRDRIQALLTPAATQTDRVIGHFHIYYDSTGPAAPAMISIDSTSGACTPIPGTADQYVDSVGAWFNHAWSYEIDTLGYLAPPVDADGYYRINIVNFTSMGNFGTYGETVHGLTPLNPGPPPTYATYIEIDNTFCDVYYPTRGMPALRVTAAHEFHHAIQLGRYGEWTSDLYFYEITSTWMETVVHPEVRDYFQYIEIPQAPPNPPIPQGQFATPDVAFTSSGGLIQYSRAIWGKFIEKRFSRDVMRHAWEYMRQTPSIPSMDHALVDAASSFRQAFLEWTLWNFHTDTLSDPVKYYREGRDYPPMATRPAVEYSHAARSFTDSIQAISSVYHPICLLPTPQDNCNASPKMLAIVSNLNTAQAMSGQSYNFVYDLADNGDATYKHLANGIWVRLDVPDPQNWSTQETDSVAIPSIVTDVVVYPNPFTPNGSKPLSFRLPSTPQSTVLLNIFTASMEKIAAEEVPLTATPAGPGVTWDGHDEHGNLVASGIYFFVITAGDLQYTGKFAVVVH